VDVSWIIDRALDDIKESIEELKYYRAAIFLQPPQ
jgi:oligoribonuclease (3'-5' exoribonuclease)